MQFRDDVIGRLAAGIEGERRFRPSVPAEVVAVRFADSTGRLELLLCYPDGVMEFFDYKECVLKAKVK